MRVNNNESQEIVHAVNGKKGFIEYIIVVIVVIAVVVGAIYYINYQNKKTEEVRIALLEEKAIKEIDYLNNELDKASADFKAGYLKYGENEPLGDKYTDILYKDPKAIEALNDCEIAFESFNTTYNNMVKYIDDSYASLDIYKSDIEDAQKQLELFNNEFLSCIQHHNGIIGVYNDWATKVMNDPQYDNFVYTYGVRLLKVYTSPICKEYIDLNENGIYEGKTYGQ